MKKIKAKNVGVSLPIELDNWLKKQADKELMPKSFLVRKLLEEYKRKVEQGE